MTPDRPDWAGRLANLTAAAGSLGLDAIVISTPTNVRYLTGFVGTSGLLVCAPHTVTLLLDGRYALAARQAVAQAKVASVDVLLVERRYDLTLGALLGSSELRHVGFEAEQVTVAALEGWQRAAPGIEWRPTRQVVERLRAIKDPFEVAALRRAAAGLADIVRQLPTLVAAGRTEREVARAIDAAIDARGFSAPAFPTIVASGPNSALPHARPTDRRLERGDLVVLDFGGVLDGYCGDLTRMAAIGPVTSAARALFDAVAEAQAAAIRTVRPGIPSSDVDRAARKALDARGLADAFVHATGHGLGLDVHEAPRLGREEADQPEPLAAGMVCTIEPGAYLESLGGVRLEDDVLVTTDGCEVLTDVPRDLMVV
jgi:Xaa-Pro aminopeptidase